MVAGVHSSSSIDAAGSLVGLWFSSCATSLSAGFGNRDVGFKYVFDDSKLLRILEKRSKVQVPAEK